MTYRHCKCFSAFLQIFYAKQNADTPQSIGNLIISTQNDVIENFDDEIDYFTNVRFCVK